MIRKRASSTFTHQADRQAVDATAAEAAASTMVVGAVSHLWRRRRGRPQPASTSTAMACMLLWLLVLLAPAVAKAPLKERILRSSAMAAAANVELPERINPSPGTDRCTTMIVGPKVGGGACWWREPEGDAEGCRYTHQPTGMPSPSRFRRRRTGPP